MLNVKRKERLLMVALYIYIGDDVISSTCLDAADGCYLSSTGQESMGSHALPVSSDGSTLVTVTSGVRKSV